MPPTTTILGAGIAGLATSYHLGHDRCVVFEKQSTAGGHTRSEQAFGFTFDEGPHVSFTKHQYVHDLFSEATNGNVLEYHVRARNYFRGSWIDHPAPAHLGQMPQPLRERCYREILEALHEPNSDAVPSDYYQWLRMKFGVTFADTFPAVYARKYWTTDPSHLGIDWLGPRIYVPTRDEVERGMKPGTVQDVHYISAVRYPTRGGYQSFLASMARGAQISAEKEVAELDLAERRIRFTDGTTHDYHQLVSTLPLNAFVKRCRNVPADVREAAAALECSQLLLVNVCAPHPSQIDGHWFYVYDEEKWSTRIHLTERLSPNNAPAAHTGVQVETYFGHGRPFLGEPDGIADDVAGELAEMGFVQRDTLERNEVQIFWRWIPYANIIFTHRRRPALDVIWSWLARHGLEREPGDLDATTDWKSLDEQPLGRLVMAGRYAQWKYFWTDDCVLRGYQVGMSSNV